MERAYPDGALPAYLVARNSRLPRNPGKNSQKGLKTVSQVSVSPWSGVYPDQGFESGTRFALGRKGLSSGKRMY